MKKNRKFILAAVFFGIFFTVLAGCGKSGGENQEGEDGVKEGSIYVPEYAQMDLVCDYMDSLAVSGDTLYISASIWNEDTGSSGEVYRYDLVENKAQKLYELGENENVYGMVANEDGSLTMVCGSDDYVYDENWEIVSGGFKMTVYKISSEDGTVIEEKEITELFPDSEYIYIQRVCGDAQGNLYLNDGNSMIYVLDKSNQLLCEINTGDQWFNSMASSKEGDVYVCADGKLKKIDLAGKKIGEAAQNIEVGWGDNLYTGLNSSFFASSNSQVSVLDLSAGTKEVLFNWLDVDVHADEIQYVGELSDGRIWAITRAYKEEGGADYELIYFTKKDRSEVAAKDEIVFGTMWMDSDIRKRIIDFNKSNEQYRIVVREYGADDYESGLIQFGADLTTANCPDLINLSQVDFAQYASKGVLEDLYPYMEKSGIKKEEYLENILKAYEVEGSLYGIMPVFYVNSIAAKTSLVGEDNGWTLTEMLDLVDEVDPPYVMMYDSRNTMLWYCVYQDIDEFIDWENGECFFNGEEFARALEFAARFPDDEDVDYSERESVETLLHENKVLLMQTTLSSVQEYQMMKGMFGEEITYVGFPNKEEKGNLIVPASGSFGISSKSQYKDGAWEFMKTLIDEEYQDGLVQQHGSWGFPIRIESLEKQFEQDMTPEYDEDEEGNQIERPKTTWGYNDFTIEIMAATQEEVDAVKALIASADKISGNTDQQIINIITEETEPFFKGQKSAADVANIIQNRVQIYVNENR